MIWARKLAYITGASIKRSRARLKPETMRVTFEEFSPAHDFFDYRTYRVVPLGAIFFWCLMGTAIIWFLVFAWVAIRRHS
jgi:hypothetical protein